MNTDTYRVIFLDIDGVLNHREWFRRHTDQLDDINDIDPVAVARVQNRWGTYDNALPWLRELAAACRRYPKATVRVSK